MSSTKSFIACATAFLSALISTNVSADSSAFVTFGTLEVALFDLDPADGIDPAVGLSQVERSGAVFQYPFPDASGPALREDRVIGTGTAALSDANGRARAALRDHRSMDGEVTSTGSGAYTALLTDSFVFTITPHTRVIFSAMTESAVNAERSQSALAVITLAGQMGSLPGEYASFESTSVRTASGSGAVPIAAETSSAAIALSGDIALRAFAYAAGVSAVPEPGQLAMLLAGLVLLAAAWTRRHRQRIASRLPRLTRTASICAAALGAAVSPSIVQASSGSASLYDFAFELFDLAPDDGVPPSLIFTSETGGGAVNANNINLLGAPWDETRNLVGYGTESVAIQSSSASVELSPDLASANAVAWGGAFSAFGGFRREFTLTPMTHVVFSAIGQARVVHDPAMRPDASEINAGLSGEIVTSPGQRTQFSSFVILNAPGESIKPLAVHAFTGGLSGTGVISATANTFAVAAAPVPEPAPWVMLSAGLAFAWVVAPARRRR